MSNKLYQIAGHLTIGTFLETYTDKSRRKACMLALQPISSIDMFKSELTKLIPTLLHVVSGTGKEGVLQLRELSVNILSNLCNENRENQKLFRRSGGIEAMIQNMQFKEVDHSGNAITFIGSVLDCLANSVFGNKRCESHFLDIEGVYVLLDLIENCEYTLKRFAISCLCTILENTKSF